MYPDQFKYTKDHEYVNLQDGLAYVGITDHAQAELGDVVFVDLPEVGLEYAQGDTFAVIESVKAVSDCYLPISGRVVKVNENLADNPGLINEDPHGEGWLVAVEPAAGEEFSALLDAGTYQEFLQEAE